MEPKVPRGSATRRYRVLRSDHTLQSCPPAGSIVYPTNTDFGCADDDSRNHECKFIACSVNESGLPFFTMPRADVDPMSASEKDDDFAGHAAGDEDGPVSLSEPRYSQPPTGTSGQHSVCQFFQNGGYEYVKRFVGLEEAVDAAIRLSTSVGAQVGTTRRVIITDGGDCTNWEWRFGEGVVFPPPTAEPTHAA